MSRAVEKAESLEQILALFAEHGKEHYGEDITQLEHALQCAALARAEQAPDTLVAAALLHDLGHFCNGAAPEDSDINDRHEQIAARLLGDLFPESVTQPIALHVAAKRYLCAQDEAYYTDLSEASKRSLAQQGGVFSDRQCESFESNPWAQDALRLRRWDDEGKQQDLVIPPLQDYIPLLKNLVCKKRDSQ